MNVQNVLSQLSTEDKIKLCSGKDFWHLESFPELEIPEIMVTDGPHGLRKQLEKSDQLGIADSYPSVCYPTASLSACSWDRELLFQMGQHLAQEAIDQKVSVLLGPGVNIKRNPLCGRNFEYFSEDPLLSGLLAASFISGVQSMGIGTSLKHFAANNQENHRLSSSSNVDQRALREIYLKPFELAVKLSQPWTIMCSYNMIDGVYSSSNPWLLKTILRDEWGFEGLVMSDWGAAHQREIDIAAGLDLEMPGNQQFYLKQVLQAIQEGSLKMEDLDRCALNVLNLIHKAQPALTQKPELDPQVHREFARKVAQQSIVLLKNNNHLLPMDPREKILVLGELAQKARFQGSGSSQVHPIQVESLLDGLKQSGIEFEYRAAYSCMKSEDVSLIEEATKDLAANQKVIVFVGLTEDLESEGFDRKDLNLPLVHNALVYAVLEKTKHVVVVLAGGAPCCMPWASQVPAILNGYLPGETGGLALTDILFGAVNPSGKLAETYPLSYDTVPSAETYGKEKQQVNYRESIFVGYRYFDSANVDVLFPFGHGLSYSEFSYKDLSYVENVVSFTLTNTTDRPGSEVVQIYISNKTKANFFASHELKAFEKVTLRAHESRVIHIALDPSAFEYYDLSLQRFGCAQGEYELQVGSSSRDIRLAMTFNLMTQQIQHIENGWHQTWYDHFKGYPTDEDFRFVYEKDIALDRLIKAGSFTIDSTLDDMKDTLAGKMMKILSKRMLMKAGHFTKADVDSNHFKMMMSFVMNTPLRSTMLLSQGALSEAMAYGIVDLANNHFIKGIKRITKKD